MVAIAYDGAMRNLLLCLVLLGACDKKPSEGERAKALDTARAKWSPAGAQWADRMVVMLSKLMCADGGYIVTCFPKATADCLTIAATQVKTCLATNPEWVPQDVNRQTGEAAGAKLGECSGSQLEMELRRRDWFTDTPHCHDNDFWRQATEQEAIKQTKGL